MNSNLLGTHSVTSGRMSNRNSYSGKKLQHDLSEARKNAGVPGGAGGIETQNSASASSLMEKTSNVKLITHPKNMTIKKGPHPDGWGGLVGRLNDVPALKSLGLAVRGPKIQFVTFLCVLWALFAQDVCFGFISDKSVDPTFSAITIVVFAILALEFTCHLFLTPSYFMSYFMLIDLVGTALLVPEIFLYRSADTEYASDNTGDSILSVARAGRVARTAAMVRIGRIVKVFRVLRTARAMQCILMMYGLFEARKKRKAAQERSKKREVEREERMQLAQQSGLGAAYVPEDSEPEEEDEEVQDQFDAKPSAFGLKYANMVSQRVVIGVLIILAVVPQLDVQELDYSRERSIDVLHSWGQSCDTLEETPAALASCTASQKLATQAFLERFDDCVYFGNYGTVEFEDTKAMRDRRKTAMTKYAAGGTTLPLDETIVAIFDDQEVETEVRIMNILLTVFVVAIFSAGSWVFNNDAKVMIIRPIERLTALVKKLAGMVFLLSAEDEELTEGGDVANEMDFIDIIAAKMSDVFEQDNEIHKKSAATAVQLMPDELEVQEKGGLLGKSPKIADSYDPLDPGNSNGHITPINDLTERETVIFSRPELRNLDACLNDPKARSYFRLFLSKEFNVENIAFWEAVYEYRKQTKKRAKAIYSTYISQAANYQINIPAAQRAKIKETLTDDNCVVASNMFDKAHTEIFRLMARDPYPRFLKSDLALTFARIAKIQEIDHTEDRESTSFAALDQGNSAREGPRGGYVKELAKAKAAKEADNGGNAETPEAEANDNAPDADEARDSVEDLSERSIPEGKEINSQRRTSRADLVKQLLAEDK